MDYQQNLAFYNYAREHQGCHVIVDPQGDIDWIEELKDSGVAGIQSAKVRHEYFDIHGSAAPYVLNIPLEHFDILEKLAKQAYEEAIDPSRQTRSVCGFVACAQAPEAVARALAGNLTVRVDARRIYFRCFDPRVMHHLTELLPVDAYHFGHIQAWAYFDWEGRFAIQRLAGVSTKQASARGIYLSPEQWAPFEALNAFNATLVAFKKAGISWSCEATEKLRQMVLETIRLSLSEPGDIAVYLVYLHQHGIRLELHEQWNEILAFVKNGAPLEEVLEGLNVTPSAT